MKLELVSELNGHEERVWCVAWNYQGSLLASCGSDKSIRIWGLEDDVWKCKTILTDGHHRTIRSVAWSPCGNYLASTSFDATTCIWDKKSGQFECNATLEGHENEVKSASWSVSGQYLATCGRDKSVWIWEIGEDEEYECASVLHSHSQDVKKVIWHPQKEELASASYDNTIKMYRDDGDDWSCFATLKSHESTVWSIAFDKSGTKLASSSDDKTVKIWKEYLPGNNEGVATIDSNPTWKCVCTLSGFHQRTIYDISWCPMTDLIVTGSGDDCIRIFREDAEGHDPNAPTFSMVASMDRAHSQDINCVTWNPGVPSMLASCGDDGCIRLWRAGDS